jgi:hypothetical protein
VCYFAYFAVQFRPMAPVNAESLVRQHAHAAGRKVGAFLDAEPGSPLATFAGDADLIGAFSCGQCACDWRSTELGGLHALARSLLRAKDVHRVRLGKWFIHGAVERPTAPRGGTVVRPVSVDDLEGVEWSNDTQIEVARTGPPWPTRDLAHLPVE